MQRIQFCLMLLLISGVFASLRLASGVFDAWSDYRKLAIGIGEVAISAGLLVAVSTVSVSPALLPLRLQPWCCGAANFGLQHRATILFVEKVYAHFSLISWFRL